MSLIESIAETEKALNETDLEINNNPAGIG